MAQDNKGMSAAEINRRMKEEMNAVKSRLKDQGLDDMQIKQIMQDYFSKAAPKKDCLLYTSPSPRDGLLSRMPSSA